MKAVLVLPEMPERCVDCDIGYRGDENTDIFCTRMRCVAVYDEDDEKPDWCPLMKMPNWKEEHWIDETGISVVTDDYANGWNDFRRTIEGSEEDETSDEEK